MNSIKSAIFIVLLVFQLWLQQVTGNPDAKRLYDDLLSNYNRLIRPVSNNTETVLVKLGLRLSQLIDLVWMSCSECGNNQPIFNALFLSESQRSNSHHQRVVGTRKCRVFNAAICVRSVRRFTIHSQLINVHFNAYNPKEWQDYKLKWDPSEYGGVTELYVPSEHIWLPDIVLYNKCVTLNCPFPL